MNPRDPTLPPRKVLQALIRKYDAVQPFDNDDLHWLVNMAHVVNEDPGYNAHQDELEPTEEAKSAEREKEDSINIEPEGDDGKEHGEASPPFEPEPGHVFTSEKTAGEPTMKYRPKRKDDAIPTDGPEDESQPS